MIEADPNARIRVTLTRHEHLPPEQRRPAFYFFPPRRCHALRLDDLNRRLHTFERAKQDGADGDRVDTAERVDAWLADAEALLTELLDRWEHITDHRGAPLTFDGSNLNDAVDEVALGNLVPMLTVMSRVGDDAKKAYGSPASSRADRSADGATRDAEGPAAATSAPKPSHTS